MEQKYERLYAMELENVFTYAVDSRSRYFDMNAVQGEKNVELDLTVKGYFFLGPILWHTAMLVLNKKFKSFIKRLKRGES